MKEACCDEELTNFVQRWMLAVLCTFCQERLADLAGDRSEEKLRLAPILTISIFRSKHLLILA